jgi:hypothetical protein
MTLTRIEDEGLRIENWMRVLRIPNPQSPILNPQSSILNPQSSILNPPGGAGR